MIHTKLRAGETAGTYVIAEPVTEAELFEMAQRMARRRLARGRKILNPSQVYQAMQTYLSDFDHEVFGLLYLDNAHRSLGFDVLFRGTLRRASVYTREVVKDALSQGAAAVIAVHNHPSGLLEPSDEDHELTDRLRQAFELIDVRLLDHVIVSPEGYRSVTRATLP